RVEELNLWAVDGLLPRLTVLLDLDPAQLPARLTGAPDRLERAGAELHHRTRQAFLERAAAHPERFVVLEAARPVEEIASEVRERVAALDDAEGARRVCGTPSSDRTTWWRRSPRPRHGRRR